jgi:hypothetical protein
MRLSSIENPGAARILPAKAGSHAVDEGAMNRRQFTSTLALGIAAAAVPDLAAQKPRPRKLRCGHTGITWGFRPEDAERAIADVASLGFHAYTFRTT